MENIRKRFEYDGYYYQVSDIVSIAVLGSLCGLRNISQLLQWAANERIREFLWKEFGVERIPCYYWFICLLKRAEKLLPEDRKGVSVSLDGKSITFNRKNEQPRQPITHHERSAV